MAVYKQKVQEFSSCSVRDLMSQLKFSTYQNQLGFKELDFNAIKVIILRERLKPIKTNKRKTENSLLLFSPLQGIQPEIETEF